MTPAEQARIAHTIVRVCAKGHPSVMYYARRDQPEPPCPACLVVRDTAGRLIAPPQLEPAPRPDGPHVTNCDARKPL